uniref:JMY/WHAMM N-terminal domain-containing protein n=1 Tax=Otus sunia TaxID=257818 RepID=A0A8C8ADZ0_9STRI
MSTFDLEETLEADWVAVRPYAFQERDKHKFVFIVAWNEIEGKFAITCHNRTAQRQRSSSRGLCCGGPAGPEARAAPMADITTVSRVPSWGTDAGLPRGTSRPRAEAGLRGSERGAATEALLKSPLRAKSSPARRPQRGPEAAGAVEEIKALKLGKEEAAAALSRPPSPLQAAEPVAPDAEPAGEECSWAGLFSFQDLRAVHQQLCSINSELEPYLPAFPEEPSGVWTVLFGAPELSEQEIDALCYELQVYLLHSLDTCGWKILSQVLFTEADDPEEYYESLSELRQKGYEEVLQRARRRIQEVRLLHAKCGSVLYSVQLNVDVCEQESDGFDKVAPRFLLLRSFATRMCCSLNFSVEWEQQHVFILTVQFKYLRPKSSRFLQALGAESAISGEMIFFPLESE